MCAAREGWVFQQRVLKFRYVLPFDQVADGLDDPLRVRWPGTEPQLADLPDQAADLHRQPPAPTGGGAAAQILAAAAILTAAASQGDTMPRLRSLHPR
jgi:hypothetical protein